LIEGIKWIQSKKKQLLLTGAISVFICIGEIVYFHSVGKITLEKWQSVVIILPWFTTFSIILALWYESWFARKKTGFLVTMLKIFYWLVVSIFCFIAASTVLRFIL